MNKLNDYQLIANNFCHDSTATTIESIFNASSFCVKVYLELIPKRLVLFTSSIDWEGNDGAEKKQDTQLRHFSPLQEVSHWISHAISLNKSRFLNYSSPHIFRPDFARVGEFFLSCSKE